MISRFKQMESSKQVMWVMVAVILLTYIVAFALSPVSEIVEGMGKILSERDVLITDYFVTVGYGAALFNAATVTLMCLMFIKLSGAEMAGMTFASLLITLGFAMFGKNPVNVLPIILGGYLYSKYRKEPFSKYVHIAVFAGCLGPIVTEVALVLPFALPISIVVAAVVGVAIGFIVPSISLHTPLVHGGHTLFNVGTSAGFVAIATVSIMNAFGYQGGTVLLWQEGRALSMYIYMAVLFFMLLAMSLLLGGKVRNYPKVLAHSGKAGTDLIKTDGIGMALMNMSIVGIISTLYIVVIGGDFSGPVVGSIVTMVGFAAVAIHPRNMTPVLFGTYLAGVIFTNLTPTTPSLQMSAILGMALAPISGVFGPIGGVLAGFLHGAIVTSIGVAYKGLDLYNNGFSTGLVAIVLFPLLHAVMFRDRDKK